MRYKVETPVRTYNGLSAGVPFTQGIGYTDNEAAITWFKSKGYKVTKVEEVPVKEEEHKAPVIPDEPNEDIEEFDEEDDEDVQNPKPTVKRKIKSNKK